MQNVILVQTVAQHVSCQTATTENRYTCAEHATRADTESETEEPNRQCV